MAIYFRFVAYLGINGLIPVPPMMGGTVNKNILCEVYIIGTVTSNY